jgi:hypothetical protein
MSCFGLGCDRERWRIILHNPSSSACTHLECEQQGVVRKCITIIIINLNMTLAICTIAMMVLVISNATSPLQRSSSPNTHMLPLQCCVRRLCPEWRCMRWQCRGLGGRVWIEHALQHGPAASSCWGRVARTRGRGRRAGKQVMKDTRRKDEFESTCPEILVWPGCGHVKRDAHLSVNFSLTCNDCHSQPNVAHHVTALFLPLQERLCIPTSSSAYRWWGCNLQ